MEKFQLDEKHMEFVNKNRVGTLLRESRRKKKIANRQGHFSADTQYNALSKHIYTHTRIMANT